MIEYSSVQFSVLFNSVQFSFQFTSVQYEAKYEAKKSDYEKKVAKKEDTAGGAKMDLEGEDNEDDSAALQTAMAMSVGQETPASVFKASTGGDAGLKGAVSSLDGNIFAPQGLPHDFTGLYELHSLVTHKGRSADGGHYIGWVRKEAGSSKWYQYNDDVVTEHEQTEIMALSGGGDRDMAYLAFYRYKTPK